jgi:sec-independent protein translocase protein TatA
MSFAVVQGIGVTELLIVLGIVLLILGPKRLPGLGRQLGSGMREFKDAITGRHDDGEDERAALADGSASEQPGAEEPVSGEVVADRDR